MGRRLTTAEFIADAIKIHGDRYDYTMVWYRNNSTPVMIWCNIHKYFFWQTPNMHKSRKNGCKICSRKNINSDEANDNRSKTILKNNIEKYGVPSVKQLHYNKENFAKLNPEFIIEKFIDNNYFLIEDFRSFIGCGQIAAHRILKRFKIDYKYSLHSFDPTKPAILYYIKDITTNYYKIGITNKTVQYRFRLKKNRFKVLKQWKFELGSDAKELEEFLHQEFTKFSIINESWLVDGQGTDGYTEFFSKDILGLDKKC